MAPFILLYSALALAPATSTMRKGDSAAARLVCVEAEDLPMPATRTDSTTPVNISGIVAGRLEHRYSIAADRNSTLRFELNRYNDRCKNTADEIHLTLSRQPLANGQPYVLFYTFRWPNGQRSGRISRDLGEGLGDSLNLPLSPLWSLMDLELTKNCDTLAMILIQEGRRNWRTGTLRRR